MNRIRGLTLSVRIRIYDVCLQTFFLRLKRVFWEVDSAAFSLRTARGELRLDNASDRL